MLDSTLYGIAYAESSDPTSGRRDQLQPVDAHPNRGQRAGRQFRPYHRWQGVPGLNPRHDDGRRPAHRHLHRDWQAEEPAHLDAERAFVHRADLPRQAHGPRGNQHVICHRAEGITGTNYAIAQVATAVNDGDPQAAFDAINQTDFDYIVSAATEPAPSANGNRGLTRFINNVNNRAQPLVGLRGVLVAALKDSYANSVTNATGINSPTARSCRGAATRKTSMRIAARHAAAIALGTSSDPTANPATRR